MHGSVHCDSILIRSNEMQQYAGVYLLQSYSTCFGCLSHPVHVTMAWRVLRLRMDEQPPIWRGAVNKLNKQPRTADEGWSSSLGVGRGANNPSP